MTPRDQIRNVRNLWAFTLLVREAVEAGRIHPGLFVRELTVDTGDHGFRLAHDYDARALDDLSQNAMVAALGVCIIATDEALRQHYHSEHVDAAAAAHDEAQAARVIVRVLRNAFAHDPLEPTWELQNPTGAYASQFRVPSIGIQCDFRVLDGQPVKPTDLGGYERLIPLLELLMDAVA